MIDFTPSQFCLHSLETLPLRLHTSPVLHSFALLPRSAAKTPYQRASALDTFPKTPLLHDPSCLFVYSPFMLSSLLQILKIFSPPTHTTFPEPSTAMSLLCFISAFLSFVVALGLNIFLVDYFHREAVALKLDEELTRSSLSHSSPTVGDIPEVLLTKNRPTTADEDSDEQPSAQASPLPETDNSPPRWVPERCPAPRKRVRGRKARIEALNCLLKKHAALDKPKTALVETKALVETGLSDLATLPESVIRLEVEANPDLSGTLERARKPRYKVAMQPRPPSSFPPPALPVKGQLRRDLWVRRVSPLTSEVIESAAPVETGTFVLPTSAIRFEVESNPGQSGTLKQAKAPKYLVVIPRPPKWHSDMHYRFRSGRISLPDKIDCTRLPLPDAFVPVSSPLRQCVSATDLPSVVDRVLSRLKPGKAKRRKNNPKKNRKQKIITKKGGVLGVSWRCFP